MLNFSSWNLLGSTAIMLKNQGVNILINIFFGPAINAANGIAYQVNSAVFQFSNNFTTAINPQIIKSYATNDKGRMQNLIIRGCKFSFFLINLFIYTCYFRNKIPFNIMVRRISHIHHYIYSNRPISNFG